MNGISELIKNGYIHRDIKPSNCLIKGDIYKVSDFGFATKADISGKIRISEFLGIMNIFFCDIIM